MSTRFCLLTFVGLLFVTLVMGYILGSDNSVRQWLIQSMLWLQSNGLTGQVLFVLALIMVSTTGLLPSSVMAVAAGSIFGLWAGLMLVMSGIFIGAIIAFMLSRYFIRSSIEAWIIQRVSLDAIDRLIGERGWRIVILLRLSPLVPFVVGSYALGVSAVRFRDYCIGTVGVIPPLFAIVYTGALANDLATLHNPRFSEWNWAQYGMLTVGLVASIVVAMMLARMAGRTLHSVQKTGPRNQARTDSSPD